MERRQIVITGAGPAGMAAAIKLKELGFKDVLVLEKESQPGGVLRQCIHHGFGLIKFGKNYTGPEYKALYEKMLENSGAELKTGITVTAIESAERHNMKNAESVAGLEAERGIVVCAQTPEGHREYLAEAVILASGCRERGRGALMIPGSRPAGIYTAGTAQGMMNLRNIKVGNEIVIVGSGDIGLIMARRFTLEGSRVICVVEKEAVCGGLDRNRKECLEDFGIPLLTGAQVCRIDGKKRVESVVIRDSDGVENEYSCDTVILAAGLVPEDEMAEMGLDGLFYCGNALFVHDLVDNVSESGEHAAMEAARYLNGKNEREDFVSDCCGKNIEKTRGERRRFVLERREARASEQDDGDYVICTQCPNGCRISLKDFSGGKCDKGADFARRELENPVRILTSTVKVGGREDEKTVSVRTENAIPRSLLMSGMELINSLEVQAPVDVGDIVCENFLNTGINLISTGKVE